MGKDERERSRGRRIRLLILTLFFLLFFFLAWLRLAAESHGAGLESRPAGVILERAGGPDEGW